MERIFTAIFLLGLICFSNIFAQTEIPTFFEKQTNNTKISSEPGALQFDLSGHQGSINTLQWSPDGTKFITSSFRNIAGEPGVAIIWSVVNGRKICTFRANQPTATLSIGSYFCDTQWSPDGTKVITAASDGECIIWSAISAEKLHVFKHLGSVNTARWSPDGTKIVTGSSDKTAIIWDAVSGTKILTLNINTGKVYSTQWSPDGTKIVTRSDNSYSNSTIIIWSAIKGTELSRLEKESPVVFKDVKWSPDGTKLVTGSTNGSCEILTQAENSDFYDVLSFSGNTDEVGSVSWNPDGSKVAIAYAHGGTIVWDAKTGTKVYTLAVSFGANNSGVYYAVWSPDGTKIATSGGSHVGFIWDAAKGVILDTMYSSVGPFQRGQPTFALLSLVWNPDGRKIASACITTSYINMVFIWNVENGKILDTVGASHAKSVNTVRWSPDNLKIASSDNSGTIIIWDAITGINLKTIIGFSPNSTINWSPDGTKIISISKEHGAAIWDVLTGTIIDTIGAYVNGGGWSPDGTKIVTYSNIGETNISIWDVATLKKRSFHSFVTIKDFRWSFDGSKIFFISRTDNVADFDIEKNEFVSGAGFIGHTKELTSICLSPDGKKIAAASWDSTVIIWSTDTKEKLVTIKANKPLTAVQWSPKGEKIATLSYDDAAHSTPIVWSATTGEKLLTLIGHTGLVKAMQWSPNGAVIATSSNDSTSIIWSAITGAKLYTLKGHSGYVNDVQWSSDGSRVATAGEDYSAKIWFASQETGVEEQIPFTLKSFSIYPNPTDNNFNLQFEQEISNSTPLSIVNILGQQVVSTQIPAGTKEQTISLEGLPKGMYMVKLNATVKSVIKW